MKWFDDAEHFGFIVAAEGSADPAPDVDSAANLGVVGRERRGLRPRARPQPHDRRMA
ncbi:hypothetical protein [Nocardia sp. NPDC050710]|uniref:hypothetical protein n=1 Tax=Nocardia sp. NPDC050710 TaxID=3157220 RepID=UPI0033F0D78E